MVDDNGDFVTPREPDDDRQRERLLQEKAHPHPYVPRENDDEAAEHDTEEVVVPDEVE